MKSFTKIFIGIAIVALGYGIFWAYNFLSFLNEFGGPDQVEFQQEIWLTHSDLDDLENPRGGMIDDLFANHLRKGFHRDKVIELLGEPYRESVTRRLPKGVATPDSITPHKFVGQPKELTGPCLQLYWSAFATLLVRVCNADHLIKAFQHLVELETHNLSVLVINEDKN